MPDPILVTGGTGVLGRLVVRRLLEAGHPVRVGSRQPRPADDSAGDASNGTGNGSGDADVGTRSWARLDLRTGDGVNQAVAGVRAIVHCATTAMKRDAEVALARSLVDNVNVDNVNRGDLPHLVYISIVGVDRVPLPYYRGKLATERLLESSGLPYTIVRATQFHDLLRVIFAGAARLPVMAVPSLSFQPIDAGEVADRLVEVALGEPLGRATDIGGPEVASARELASTYLRAIGRRRVIAPISLPGKAFRGYADGGHLTPANRYGTVTFADYLAAQGNPRRLSYR